MSAVRLDSLVRIRPQFRRSTNLERDAGQLLVEEYILTGRSLEILARLIPCMRRADLPSSFSLTGPYGSGKSSFAVFLDALLGPEADASSKAALGQLTAVNAELAGEFAQARTLFGLKAHGAVRAVTTAQREPVSVTIARAMHHGVDRFAGRAGSRTLRKRLSDTIVDPLSARELCALIKEVAELAPLLLVVDELGKNLEYFSAAPDDGDLYVLQSIAETVSGSRGLPAVFLTMQHQAFDQYSLESKGTERREWSKIQGRFQDISFVGGTDEGITLLSQAISLTPSMETPAVASRLSGWAKQEHRAAVELGLVPHLVADDAQIRGCYPLNPIAVLVLCELCSRFGQHDRTLFSFLGSDETGSLREFLNDHHIAQRGPLPTVTLDLLWDYFVESSFGSVAGSVDGRRWLEVRSRISEVRGLTSLQERCAKAVGLLNLVASGGTLRASVPVIAQGLGSGTESGRLAVVRALSELEAAGVVTFREFASEYRIWQGTDFDVTANLESARRELATQPIEDLLEQVQPLRPVVASRHSQSKGILRYFDVRFFDPNNEISFDPNSSADGLVAIVLGVTKPRVATSDMPIVVVQAPLSRTLSKAVLEAAATLRVLSSAQVQEDWVARRELQELAAISAERTKEEVGRLLSSVAEARQVGKRRKVSGKVNLSKLISDVCDEAYDESPDVRNEMVARRELTSQGAKARRLLLDAMLTHSEEERLGIDGFGPERSLYEALLRHTGLHRQAGGRWEFKTPNAGSSWTPAWKAITAALDEHRRSGVSVAEVYRVLSAPPIGLKEGPIPVLLIAFLLANQVNVAVYQDGTFQPRLTSALVDRLIRTPERFQVRPVEARGRRATLVDALSRAFGVEPSQGVRNTHVLTAVAPLLTLVRDLPEYSRRTEELSGDTLRVRAALREARDPAELLFDALPRACELDPIGTRAGKGADEVDVLVGRIQAAADELQLAYPRMLEAAVTAIASQFRLVPEMPELRTELRAHARPLDGKIVDRRLRSFVALAVDKGLDDREWLEALLLQIADSPPLGWSDDDVRRFEVRLVMMASQFDRVRALNFEVDQAHRTGFEAMRVTLTMPDGTEMYDVHWVDDALREHVDEVAELAVGRLEDELGPRGLTALIAVLPRRAAERRPGGWQEDAETIKSNVTEAADG